MTSVWNEISCASPELVPIKANRNIDPLLLLSQFHQAKMPKDKSLNSWALKHVKDLLQRVDPVHFQYGMAHVTKVSTCNNNVTLHTIGWKRWVTYSFNIAMKVKGEVCTTKGLDILLNHNLEGMLNIPNVSCGKLDNLQLQVSIPQSCIAISMQRTTAATTLRALMLLII
jgi:hypothetical protein